MEICDKYHIVLIYYIRQRQRYSENESTLVKTKYKKVRGRRRDILKIAHLINYIGLTGLYNFFDHLSIAKC